MHAGTLVSGSGTPVGGRRTRLGSSVDPVPPAVLGVPLDCLVASLLEPRPWVQPLAAHLHLELGLAIMLEGALGGPE